jgi:hypothetical protein
MCGRPVAAHCNRADIFDYASGGAEKPVAFILQALPCRVVHPVRSPGAARSLFLELRRLLRRGRGM